MGHEGEDVAQHSTPAGETILPPGQDPTALLPAQIEALLTISSLLNHDFNTGPVLEDMLLQVCALFRADRAACFLREKLLPSTENPTFSEAQKLDVGPIVCPASTGLSQHYIQTLIRLYEQREFSQLQATRHPVFISDARQDHRLNGLRELNRQEGFYSMLTLPLIYQGALIGTLVLYHDRPHTYSSHEIRLLSILTNQVALAIANTRLYEMARAREREAAQLADAGRIFNSSLTTHEVLHRVVRTVGEMAGNSALVYIIQEGLGEAYPVAFYSKATQQPDVKVISPVKQSRPVQLGKGAIGRVLQNGLPFMMRDTAEISRSASFVTPEQQVNSLICAPLRARGQIIGALLAYQIQAGQAAKPYEDEQLGLVMALADRAAIAIDNARRYDAEKRQQRVKDEFLTQVSHELNTPLANIKGFNRLLTRKLSEALERSGAPNPGLESLRHYVEVINGQTDRLQLLVGDLARIALIETGQLQPQLESFELLPLAQAEVRSLEAALASNRERRVEHRFEITAIKLDLAVQADRQFVIRIIQSLLSNSVKFSPEGGLVRITLAEAPGRTVRLTISDQGIGITEQELPFIFDRFYKASSHPGRANGLGMGLYISKSLAEAMGGRLSVKSQEGQGSQFTLQLVRA